MKYLVTGIKSGLGKYLFKNLLNSDGLYRNNFEEISSNKYDIIIHCAFNKKNILAYNEYYDYLDDNVFLTQRLLNLPYKKFIYISSVDIYGNNNMYSMFKQFAESIVIKNNNIVILRLPVLLGSEMKPNHLFKMLKNEKISLSDKSTFNYILYSDLLNIILNYNFTNTIYNIVSNDTISLKYISNELNINPIFGSFIYNTPNNFINPVFTNKTSLETIREFIDENEKIINLWGNGIYR